MIEIDGNKSKYIGWGRFDFIIGIRIIGLKGIYSSILRKLGRGFLFLWGVGTHLNKFEIDVINEKEKMYQNEIYIILI